MRDSRLSLECWRLRGYVVTGSGYAIHMPVTLVDGKMLPLVGPLHPTRKADVEDQTVPEDAAPDVRLRYRRRRPTRGLRIADTKLIADRAARRTSSR